MPLAVILFTVALSAQTKEVISQAPGMTGGQTKRTVWVVKPDRNGRLVRVLQSRSSSVASKEVPVAPAPAPPALQKIVDQTAQRYEVDPLLVHSVIAVESNYQQKAVSPKGAQGLMQLIPATAKRFGAANAFDPQENIEAGVKYLRFLQDRFKDNLPLALAAYNAGEGAVAKYNNSVPPYRETQEYVVKVGRRYDEAKKKTAPAKTAEATAPEKPGVTAPPAEEFRHIEHYVDQEGRLFIRTR